MTPRSRRIISWAIAIAAHAVLLISLGSLTLAGGRPAKPGAQRAVTLNLSAGPVQRAQAAPAPPKPESKPRPKPEPKAHPIPKSKPKPKPKPEPEQPKPEPEPQPAPAATPNTQPTQGQDPRTAGQTSQSQGRKGIAGDPGQGAHRNGDHDNQMDRYLAKVRDTIEYNKVYPARARMRRQQGQVVIRFQVNADGRAEQVSLAGSSDSRILDQQSLDLVRRLRFPPPPSALAANGPIPVKIPIRYQL